MPQIIENKRVATRVPADTHAVLTAHNSTSIVRIRDISIHGALIVGASIPEGAPVKILFSTDHGELCAAGRVSRSESDGIAIQFAQPLDVQLNRVLSAGSATLVELLRRLMGERQVGSDVVARETDMVKSLIDALLSGQRAASTLSTAQLHRVARFCGIGVIDAMLLAGVLSPQDLHSFAAGIHH